MAELSGAAAPFRFDIRKLHFSEEVFTLEDELHKHFAPRAVNLANLRNNASSSPPTDTRAVLPEKYGDQLEFGERPEATDYYQSPSMWPARPLQVRRNEARRHGVGCFRLAQHDAHESPDHRTSEPLVVAAGHPGAPPRPGFQVLEDLRRGPIPPEPRVLKQYDACPIYGSYQVVFLGLSSPITPKTKGPKSQFRFLTPCRKATPKRGAALSCRQRRPSLLRASVWVPLPPFPTEHRKHRP